MRILNLFVSVSVCLLICGCGNQKVEEALDTDANGYKCSKCSVQFYTDREVFANVCPSCKDTDLVRVFGYLCEQDKAVTLAPRGFNTVRCRQCGKPTTGQVIPKESHYKAAGASKKTAAEVGA